MGQSQDTYGSLLVPVVIDKMPVEIKKQLASEKGDNSWLLEDLRREINREIGILETGNIRSEPEVEEFSATASFHTGANYRKPLTPTNPATPNYPRPSTGSSSHRPEIKCSFCDSDYKSHECKTHPDAESRLKIKHVLTKLIVFDVHKNQLHSGVNSTITQIRQKYWIPSIRQCVRSLLRTCIQCTRVTGRPYAAPDPPPLPKVRVSEAPPFSVTGVDFTGALFVKKATGSETKCYICFFTCASTRAVHLEVVQDLSTDSFLQAFRRFASRKSLPMVMISDNATTYIAAANHLKKLFNSQVVQEELSRKGTEWRFIPKRAPWYGGFWERLIALTKTSLKKILGRRYVSMETLQTIVTEIEAVINDRPLTHVSSSIDDLEPLTPSHLLYGRKMTSLPHHTHLPDDEMMQIQSDQTTLTNRAKQQSDIIEQFWRRWKSEYLTALREFHTTTGSNEKRIRVGDVVQIYDEGPRIRWKLAVVLELMTGNDGSVRAAKIKTKRGITNRPIVKLYPLETASDVE
ncbi:uncharacterized protein LOC127869617 [Dreissena polymorpha]|uniref:uncharacterized protein LOC127869617 n=1 Tax=Dreissena polymorpha TaxID=45954 RepID=UPI002263CED5|nr:uncharacterized protein LOC127869617 [Dreissena polymorpha]